MREIVCLLLDECECGKEIKCLYESREVSVDVIEKIHGIKRNVLTSTSQVNQVTRKRSWTMARGLTSCAG